MNQELNRLKKEYERDGFITGVEIVDLDTANYHRKSMEKAESKIGAIHYKPKVHTILKSPYKLATLPRVLNIVERLIGPNILVYNVTYIIKEANTATHVSWHQDLTYWGLSHDDQVSMWLALSPATLESGCMQMIPGSHLNGRQHHENTKDKSNVLLQGQTVRNIDENQSVTCALEAGEASFHHGWTLHSSMPNQSDDRRIGLNVQYIATHVKQTKHDVDSAILVRGEDTFNYFENDIPADTDLEADALLRQQELELRYVSIAGSK